jgi:hypothetical protein
MTEIVKINDAQIECIKEEGDVFVAMKPICEILGVSIQKQLEKLKNDENQLEQTGNSTKWQPYRFDMYLHGFFP